jgi:tRNA A-37 threonylcarbamoyl transferase component Bud32
MRMQDGSRQKLGSTTFEFGDTELGHETPLTPLRRSLRSRQGSGPGLGVSCGSIYVTDSAIDSSCRSGVVQPSSGFNHTPRDEDIITPDAEAVDIQNPYNGYGGDYRSEEGTKSTPTVGFGSSQGSDLPQVDTSDLQWMEQVGCGQTSQVFRGFYKGDQVAIKKFSNFKKQNTRFDDEEMLAREIAIMCLVRHQHVVQLHGVVMESTPILVMEYCEGGSCYELIHKSASMILPYTLLHAMSTQVAVAMDYLHKFTPCIIHRDLKSLNILLDQPVHDTQVMPFTKVADFGLARVMETDTAMTLGVGTGRWMAPEMFLRQPYKEKVDVYSFGMVLYEFICRSIPFGRESPLVIRRMVLDGERPDLSTASSDWPSRMIQLITTCWDADPAKRPSFEEIIKVLDEERG